MRYPTAGSSSPSEAQPFYVNSPYGLVLAHVWPQPFSVDAFVASFSHLCPLLQNGNLTNSAELTYQLQEVVHRHINTDSDSEVLLNILADELQKTGKARINEEDLFKAVKSVLQQCQGGFACTAMVTGYGIFGFRDPHGIRPLIYGKRDSPHGTDYMITSESVGLSALGFTPIADVKPGECIIITKNTVSKRVLRDDAVFSPCIFEYVYFARPDSVIDGISVYNSRLKMGEELAAILTQQIDIKDIDVIIPVSPDRPLNFETRFSFVIISCRSQTRPELLRFSAPPSSVSATARGSSRTGTLAGPSSCPDRP